MKIQVWTPKEEELKSLGVKGWPIWESPITTFPWEYDSAETCLFLEGHVVVETQDGQKVEIRKGDMVKFPVGLKCVWKVLEPVRKHYNFE